MIVTLRFENRTAARDGEVSEIIDLRVDRTAINPIMAWYGAYYAGDDYDVFINGRQQPKDQNGEFEPVTING